MPLGMPVFGMDLFVFLNPVQQHQNLNIQQMNNVDIIFLNAQWMIVAVDVKNI
jgi:hypothetical protein